MTVFQLVSSIFKLMNQMELQFNLTLINTEEFLKANSQIVRDLTENDKAKTSVGLHILQLVFRFYQQLVVRCCKAQVNYKVDLKETLATFIDTILLL